MKQRIKTTTDKVQVGLKFDDGATEPPQRATRTKRTTFLITETLDGNKQEVEGLSELEFSLTKMLSSDRLGVSATASLNNGDTLRVFSPDLRRLVLTQ